MNALLTQLSSIKDGSLTPVFGLLIDTALKGSLLILAAAIVVYFLRGRSAAARHAAWSAAETWESHDGGGTLRGAARRGSRGPSDGPSERQKRERTQPMGLSGPGAYRIWCSYVRP